jgi:transitional endoplasmic reticulum ATPase
MLEDAAYKEILEDRYRQYRNKADTLREKGEHEAAANYYRKCADVMGDIADRESSEGLTEKRRKLAENLATAAEKLESGEFDSGSDEPSGDSGGSGGRGGSGSSGGRSGSGGSGGGGHDDDEVVDAEQYLSEAPDLDFSDVGGMSDLKQTIRDKVIDPLERSELYEEEYGISVLNGLLMYGPPGTGKTYLTRALAGELGYNFIEVTSDDISSSLVGEASQNVAELFEVARDNQPCLVFIDEIDAIASQRSGGAQKTQSERQMVNQLLQELTDIQGEDIIVVGATNLLEEVDDAIQRTGRFDERVEVPPPDATARKAILRVHLREKPVLSDDMDWERIAGLTEGFVASDMELVATEAAFAAIDEIEGEEVQPITQEHIEQAIEGIEPSRT